MRADNPNPVTARIAVKAGCVFVSPAIIGGGFGDNTDYDVLRDSCERPFLPGSTVAGRLRSMAPDAKALFGVYDRMSPLWVLDSELDGDIIALDGVALDRENKVAVENRKYDYEAVTAGTAFTLRMLLTVRKDDDTAAFDRNLQKLAGALKSGEVAFGAKTRRGFGRVRCDSVAMRTFDLSPGNVDILEQWIDFNWKSDEGYTEAESVEFAANCETLRVRLALDGSMMIRDTRNIYENLRADEKEPDSKHISIGGTPVIPGTSWAGAVRTGLYRLLMSDSRFSGTAEAYLDGVFGYAKEDDSTAEVSSVSFGMSTLKISDEITDGYRSVTRVKIDRFTGGAADGALFTEKPWFGGETGLEIRFPESRADIRELMLLALDAIDKGLIQVGGEGSVGRGFFKVLSVNGEPLEVLTSQPKQRLIAAIMKAGEIA